MKKTEKKMVYCRGKIAGTSKICGTLLYRSDGNFLYINDFILNPDDEVQMIVCSCGYRNFWKRNDDFAKKRLHVKKPRLKSNFRRND